MLKLKYSLSPFLIKKLMRLEALRVQIESLPINPRVLAGLRESALFSAIHYSTQIEGNRLTQVEVRQTIKDHAVLQAKKRDQAEALGYYVAYHEMERLAEQKKQVAEQDIQKIHDLVMAEGKTKVKPTPYRTVQNAIYEGATRRLVYLPPEPQDVPILMKDLFDWLHTNPDQLPYPLVAAIVHYQYATIHPYIDGNGRTARLFTTLVLHQCGYDLKGIYSLDEYYAKNLPDYYEALTIGPSHNYYMGRAESDITPWLEYFVDGMVDSFERVQKHTLREHEQQAIDTSFILRTIDVQKRLVLTLFQDYGKITAQQIADLLNIHPRTARLLCQRWVEDGFFVVADPSKKSRKYALSAPYNVLIRQ